MHLNLPDMRGRLNYLGAPKSSVSNESLFWMAEPSKDFPLAAMLRSPPPAIETLIPSKVLDS